MTLVAAGLLHGGEDMRTDQTVWIRNCNGNIQEGLKTLPDIEPLGLAADEHRYRLERAHHLTRRLGRDDPGRLR